MPTYCLVCPKCGHKQEIFKAMSQSQQIVRCEKCRAKMRRSFSDEHPGAMTDWTDQLESNGAGVSANQVAEARAFAKKRGIPIEYKKDGTALFRSKRSRDKALRALGLVDKDSFC